MKPQAYIYCVTTINRLFHIEIWNLSSFSKPIVEGLRKLQTIPQLAMTYRKIKCTPSTMNRCVEMGQDILT